MFKLFRDRSIVAACLVLYALSMMVVSLGQIQAKSIGNIESITTFGVLCSGDLEGQALEPLCPFCRLADSNITPEAAVLSPYIGWAFAVFVQVEKHIVRSVSIDKCSAPRAPPLSG